MLPPPGIDEKRDHNSNLIFVASISYKDKIIK